MRKTIVLTEKQIKEFVGDEFTYLDDSNIPNYNGQSEISVSGYKERDKFGDPQTTDNIANQMSPQYYASMGQRKISTMREDVNGDGVDDFYNNEQMDVLGDGDEDNNLTNIPQSVNVKLDSLLQQMKDNNLSPKQHAMVLNKLIEDINTTDIPYRWKKELILKLNRKTK